MSQIKFPLKNKTIFFSDSMAVFVLLERISPGLTNQNTFNSVHAMNYEIIVLLCC